MLSLLAIAGDSVVSLIPRLSYIKLTVLCGRSEDKTTGLYFVTIQKNR